MTIFSLLLRPFQSPRDLAVLVINQLEQKQKANHTVATLLKAVPP